MHVDTHLSVEAVAIENAETVTVMLELAAPQVAEEAQRPVHTAVVVLDRSGSMSGAPLHAAKSALLGVVARLADTDQFGLVAFDDQALVVVPAGPVGGLGREWIAAQISSVAPGGMTDLSAGYLRGLAEARRVAGPAGATVVLLSDGHANSGVTDPQALSGVAATALAASQRVTTSTIGIGDSYDERLIAAIATGGAGNHTFAADADAAGAALSGEVAGLLSKSVQAASLLIEPSAEVASVQVLHNLPSHGVPGGILVELGDFYSGESRRLLVDLEVPAIAALGLLPVAGLTLDYVELPALVGHTITWPVAVNVVPGDVAAGRIPAPEVVRQKLLITTQSAKLASENALRTGDVEAARRALREARAALAGVPTPATAAEAADIQAELSWLDETEAGLAQWDANYSSKRLRTSYTGASRGYQSRSQGGEKGGATRAAGPRLRLRPTRDDARIANALRAQLQIDRQQAAALAADTLDILARGQYQTRLGTVDISGWLAQALANAIGIAADEPLPALRRPAHQVTTVQVANTTSLAAAQRLARTGHVPLVLNLANGVTPGGGFRSGSRAQEEYLCRSTALYPTLVGKPMYAAHRARSDFESSAAAVYSPGVPVLRDDNGALLSRPWLANFVSMAAPVATRVGQPRSAALMADRIRRLLHLAASNAQHQLVLGAWGCGAFGNDAVTTAHSFAEALSGEFAGQFDQVVFAISDWSDERRHLGPFRDEFARFR